MSFVERLKSLFGGKSKSAAAAGERTLPLAPHSVAELKASAERLGLGDRWAQIERLATPCVRLRSERVDPGTISEASSFLRGGIAYLPAGEEWPRAGEWPLEPLARIRLKDLPTEGVVGRLPQSGVLTFWYSMQEESWGGSPSDRANFRVMFHGEGVALERRAASGRFCEYQKEGQWAPTCRIQFEPSVSLPDPEDAPSDAEVASDDSYFSLKETLSPEQGHHQLLGFPSLIQGAMQEQCQYISSGFGHGIAEFKRARAEGLSAGVQDWVLLLQLDSDEVPGWQWGDCGRLYFWIRKQDLARGDFSRCWQILQCY